MQDHAGTSRLLSRKRSGWTTDGALLLDRRKHEIHLSAALVGPTKATGFAKYHSEVDDEQIRSLFVVQAHGVRAINSSGGLTVAVDGIVVGQLIPDANGDALLAFSTTLAGP